MKPTAASAYARVAFRLLLRLATCALRALNCFAVTPDDCWLAVEAATYMAAATAATAASIRNPFTVPPLPPRQMRGNCPDSTTPLRPCQLRGADRRIA